MICLAYTKELIDKIMSDEKLKKALNRGDKVYHDEPIIRPASQLKNVTPFRIQKLKNMMWSAKYQILSSERSFYLLSDFMKDYEDDYEEEVRNFNHYLPSYYEMTEPQMRSYFTWRTHVRKGEIKKTFLSFAYVYMYELMNLRGADTPEDAFEKLYDFYCKYKELDTEICSDAVEWLRDFVVYHGLSGEYAAKVFDIESDLVCKRLLNPGCFSDDELFESIALLSAYDIKNSDVYKKYTKLTVYAVCKVYRALDEYFTDNRLSSLCSYLIGSTCRYPHVMFYKALFYDSKKIKDYIYKVSDMRTYICSGGRWYISGMLYADHKNLTLGNIVEACAAVLRQKVGIEKEPVYSLKTKYILKIINKEIGSIKVKSAPETPKIEIDVSKLEKIRTSADVIREKLIVDDDLSAAAYDESITEKNDINSDVKASDEQMDPVSFLPDDVPVCKDITEKITPEDKPDNDNNSESVISLLENTESAFLKLVLESADYHSYVKKNRLLISVLADSVNEKLFDVFNDTVLESDGDDVTVIEDYREELGKMFSEGK